MPRLNQLVVLIMIVTVAGFSAAHADERCAEGERTRICIDSPYPTEGHECRIMLTESEVPVQGARITVVYRPNSEVSQVDTLGRTNGEGWLDWSPDIAGIATLHASSGQEELASLTLSVRFRSVPVLGFLVMLLAAAILFGGNSYSFAKTFGKS